MTEWNSFRTDSPQGAVTSELITFPGGNGDQIHAYVSRPTGAGVTPGVVAVHHMPGWDEFFREFSDRLARHGYTVICPNLYDRFGQGSPDDIAAKVRGEGGVPDDSVVADCAAAREWLLAQPTSNGKTGIIGTCSGGRHSLLTACRTTGWNAVGDLWGGGVIMSAEELSPARPVAPIDYIASLSAPVLGLFGNEDKYPTPEQVDQLEAELARHGKEYEFHRYDGASHGFFYYFAPMYRPEATMDGWEKIFAFFGQHLAS
ncbi:MAG TPA: dienelactone hydrolase family protein [Streptosporangiaceae bacterium]|jgi:carboxymethylenebutenolidase|nr:dienelactone hydrolase family protein [Streptosporangiaceae bacterium]